MNELEWFHYWNDRLWQAVAKNDLEAECQAIAYLYCKPEPPL
jgi:hypothetical protein